MSVTGIMTHRIGLLLIISIFFIIPAISGTQQVSGGSDIAFTSISSPHSGTPGHPIYTWFSLENNGKQISMTETVSVYLSEDTNITSSDHLIGETEVAFLRPEESEEKGIVCSIPQELMAGDYFIGAIVKGKNRLVKDAHEEDNTIAGNRVSVTSRYTRPQEWYNSRINDLVWRYTNEERKKRALGELERDEKLDLIADEMSRDMAARQFFDHTNPDGEDPIDRAERNGYPQLRYLPDGEEFYGISENIVKIPVGDVFRFGDISPDDPEQISRVAIQSFMDSPTHKATLILPEFQVIGLGTAYDGSNYYITQNYF